MRFTGYYSHRNLWQLDIISTCRKLSIPLETVKQILSLKNNGEIVKLLMAYRDEAIRLSAYYQQVADDIIDYYVTFIGTIMLMNLNYWYEHQDKYTYQEISAKGQAIVADSLVKLQTQKIR